MSRNNGILALLPESPSVALRYNDQMGYRPNHETFIEDKLTAEGLVLRVAVPGDRRAHLVRLTPKGQKAFADHAASHEAWIDDILSGLDAGDINKMIVLFDQLNEKLEEREQNAK